MKKTQKVKKGSIQSGRDLVIACGTLVIAFSVITLIMIPAMSVALPAVVSAGNADCEGCEISALGMLGNIDCDTTLELPPGSVIWICQYLVYSNETGDLVDIDLCSDDDWAEYGELIEELTGLGSMDEFDVLHGDMISQKPYVKGYLEDQGFSVISCLDCDCFWDLVKTANDCQCPVRIAMYDCCCVVLPIIPVFIY